MKADLIMQRSNQLLEHDVPILGGSTLPDKDREFNLVLEITNLTRLGDSCDDDMDSNSSYDEITKGKKSQNMTECVPVPSSEHVAEIVGRQGCKIKALRNKTNTYIKTPVRGEEPVFVVTGRKEDVAMARREVQSAAEHFTQIRASRSRHALGQPGGVDGEGAPGTITLQVRVPYRVVGLVVGPKGATIKRIQQQTHTYIVTPSREKEPVFEVTGLPENVEKAREEIEAHIAARTGTQHANIDDDFKNNGTEVGSPSVHDFMKPNMPVPNQHLYKNNPAISSAFIPYNTNSMLRSAAPSFFPSALSIPGPYQPTTLHEHLSAAKHQMSLRSNLGFQPVENINPPTPQWSTAWTTDSGSLSETSTATPTFGYGAFSDGTITSQSSGFGARSNSTASHGESLSPTSSLGAFPRLSPTLPDHQLACNNHSRRPVNNIDFSSMPNCMPASSTFNSTSNLALTIESGYSSGGTNDSAAGSPVESDTIAQLLSQFTLDDAAKPQRCVLCNEGPVVAALVPCGHNLFCYSCADNCVKNPNPICPCCRQAANMALLIKK